MEMTSSMHETLCVLCGACLRLCMLRVNLIENRVIVWTLHQNVVLNTAIHVEFIKHGLSVRMYLWLEVRY